jgi:hypothetical protein
MMHGMGLPFCGAILPILVGVGLYVLIRRLGVDADRDGVLRYTFRELVTHHER